MNLLRRPYNPDKQARLALWLLKAFLTWCESHPEYRSAVAAGNAAKSK